MIYLVLGKLRLLHLNIYVYLYQQEKMYREVRVRNTERARGALKAMYVYMKLFR